MLDLEVSGAPGCSKGELSTRAGRAITPQPITPAVLCKAARMRTEICSRKQYRQNLRKGIRVKRVLRRGFHILVYTDTPETTWRGIQHLPRAAQGTTPFSFVTNHHILMCCFKGESEIYLHNVRPASPRIQNLRRASPSLFLTTR